MVLLFLGLLHVPVFMSGQYKGRTWYCCSSGFFTSLSCGLNKVTMAVAPPTMLFVSLCECAQKSHTVVIPLNGLPAFLTSPILHSWATSSNKHMLAWEAGASW